MYQYYHIIFAQFWQVDEQTINKLFTLDFKPRKAWGFASDLEKHGALPQTPLKVLFREKAP